MRFFGSTSEIVFKLMCTLCQIKIASNKGEYWGIESEYDLHNKLGKFCKKFIEQKRTKEHLQRIREMTYIYVPESDTDLILALHLQFHQLNQVQELSQVKNKNLYPSICLTDSS